ncbi:MAG: ABC transporter ATP-binding protein [Pseudomonadota bacterium]
MKPFQAFLRLLNSAPRQWVSGLLILMFLASTTEGIGLLLLVPMLAVLGGSDAVATPPVAQLLSLLQATGLALSLGSLLLAFLVLLILRSIILLARARLAASLQYQVVDAMRQRCFAALLGVEWRWIAAGRKSDHANLLLTDVNRVGVGLNFGLALLATMATAGAYLVVAVTLSWAMTLMALASGGLVFWLLAGHRREALRLGQTLGGASRALHGNVQESLAGIKLTKILGSEGRHLDFFMRMTRRLRDEQLRFATSTSLAQAWYQIGGGLLLAAFLYMGLSFWNIPLPELLVLVMVFARLIPLFMAGHQNYHHWLHAMPALDEVDRLLAECRRFAEPARDDSLPSIPVRDSVCLDSVTVRYEGRQEDALAAVSICFPARTTTAIMGASGAGKSTLADVLMGLLLPDAGVVKVDGVEIDASRRMAWRRSVAYVSQEVFLFHDSIRNNLQWGRQGATESEMVAALKHAAADFVFGLPAGLDTVVGDGGVRLSGGERQRIALARALLTRPGLLILDEATSALDLENEARIRQAIENLHGDLTVVIIGHRLPTLEHADQVVVLEHGRIARQGTWADVQYNAAPLP